MNEEKSKIGDFELENLTKDELIAEYRKLSAYATGIEEREKKQLMEIAKLKNIILMNYANSKESDGNSQISDNDQSCSSQTKSCLVDPTINAVIIQLKKDLEETRKKKEELEVELNSTKFTPESQLTKRLMYKCRKLLTENEELGKIISSGNVAQLEHDLAYHKQLLNETCENEQNLNSFLMEIDSQMDAMQATILQLKEKLDQKDLIDTNNKNDCMET
ncbi:pre-mRNA-splicing regulator WTAP [Brachionus plicatilis]|uniref:Pre-mRNA-splicing regulator WTAP n=1 Tax=Brachionus plicatilis TaxID=10195 RepID=A0A3M7SB76_BRAPC|nr:pre-mRNA-splicing regulator WTAP [Brachionus plicatilis]